MMLNMLEDYIAHSLPEVGSFETRPGLRSKVDDAGRLIPFRGNTTVFLLGEEDKRRLSLLQEGLYRAAPDMLAQPLDADTFHVTLHDLANGTPEQEGLSAWMAQTEAGARPLLALCRELPPLHMRTTWMFNMVNTSIVLGVKPADEDSWRRLDAMYGALETVRPLGYALTPHITLAYYRPGWYSQDTVERLRHALGPVDMTLTLDPAHLVLQNFDSMNHYETV
ncbi:MAG: hypothetical protein ACI4MJ_06450 [Aristaeellaceae bacterium]